jgi:hypothetical protein
MLPPSAHRRRAACGFAVLRLSACASRGRNAVCPRVPRTGPRARPQVRSASHRCTVSCLLALPVVRRYRVFKSQVVGLTSGAFWSRLTPRAWRSVWGSGGLQQRLTQRERCAASRASRIAAWSPVAPTSARLDDPITRALGVLTHGGRPAYRGRLWASSRHTWSTACHGLYVVRI